MTVQWISRRRVAQLIAQADLDAPAEIVEQLTQALFSGPDADIKVSFPRASELLEVYRYRFESLPDFRESRVGWNSLFRALSQAEGRVGMLSIISEPWRILAILEESTESVLACLIRHPNQGVRPKK